MVFTNMWHLDRDLGIYGADAARVQLDAVLRRGWAREFSWPGSTFGSVLSTFPVY